MNNTHSRLYHYFFGVVLIMSILAFPLHAEVYKTKAVFLQENLGTGIGSPKPIWLRGEVKDKVEAILAHPYQKLRVKYWGDLQKTVWILEEIGKEKPITTGIVVSNNRISKVEILAFRESRGWEVKYPFFLKQFMGISLKENNYLNSDIDGITGATLSVRAVKKLARMALYLHKDVVNQ